MAQQSVRDSERLAKLSEGKCDVDDVEGVIDRVVDVAVLGLIARSAGMVEPESIGARRARIS